MYFVIKLAGVPVKIVHRYSYIKTLCQDYITDEPALFSVSVTEEQIEAERAFTNNRFSQEVCESTCLHREIVKGLVTYGVILIHSAAIAVDGVAYVFLAKSGVGKSTHIGLWQTVFSERAVVVNGDKPLFSFQDDVLLVHGSPWRGKEQLGNAISMPVGGICLLERGAVNHIEPAGTTEIIEKLFHQVLLPTTVTEQALFMGLINRIVKEVPMYKLRCNKEQEAALVAYRGMKKEKTP